MRTPATEPVSGRALYMLVLSRLFAIILAAMLIPGAIVPLGLNGAMAGVLAAGSLSVTVATFLNTTDVTQIHSDCDLDALQSCSSHLRNMHYT
jgi:fatty acid desaturase